MEGFLFLLFIAGIVMIIITTIALSKVKNRVNDLQKQIIDLSIRLEKSIGSSEIDTITEEEIIEAIKSKAVVQEARTFKKIEKLPGTIRKNDEPKIEKPKVEKPKSNWFTIESIISKLGIFLLLIGVGFIYRLAYDNGYVTPSLVVFFGYIFGIIVVIMGLRVRRKNRAVLSQVLFGGGVAILYITTFAAYQGYGLMKGFLAFIILFVITGLSFFIALSINSVAMSIVALLGSLVTPFVVGLDVLGLYGTGVYILFIAIGSMAIYVFKRWRILQLTSIVGISLTTLLLSLEGGFTSKETVEFSILLVAILLVFYGVEYVHYYLGKDYAKELFLTAALISALPIITLFQTLMVLDISTDVWALIFTIVSLVFFGLNYMLYKKREHSLITDILMGYIGLFVLVGIILYFGGEVRYMAILMLSVIFIVIHKKSAYLLTRIIGLVIYFIGFSWAFIDLIEQVFDEEIDLIKLFVRLIVMILITFVAWMQKDFSRKVIGGLTFQVYFFIAILSMIMIWTKDIFDPIVMTVLVFGATIILFIWLNKKFQLLSIHAVVIMSMIPFILKIIGSGFVIFDNKVDWFQTIAFIIYGVEMYILSLTVIKNDAKYLIFLLKLVGYGMLTSIVLVEVTVWSDHFGYGLLLLVCIVLIMDYFEDAKDSLIKILILLYKFGFMAIFIMYTLSLTSKSEFNFFHFVVDLIMLVALTYFIHNFIIEERLFFVMITLTYMLVIYQNLSMGENGIVTLFWAAYGIISLAYFLLKGKRNLVYISLGMIVFVAAKFIFIDLSTIETVWKIITSMAFGAALLVLSYVIQPLLDKYEKDHVNLNDTI